MRTSWVLAASMVALFASSGNSYARSCGEVLQLYNAGPAPKAYAASASGKACGYATANTTSSFEDAKSKAVMFCQQSRGLGCRVTHTQGGSAKPVLTGGRPASRRAQ